LEVKAHKTAYFNLNAGSTILYIFLRPLVFKHTTPTYISVINGAVTLSPLLGFALKNVDVRVASE